MSDQKYDFMIVGSGAGGATLARELIRQNKSVLVLEKGGYVWKMGSFQDSLRFYDANPVTKIPKKSKEGVILWRTLMAGGSTVVSCGNATRCLETELADLGIELSLYLTEAEREMEVSLFPEDKLTTGSQKIRKAADEMGYPMKLMPKFIHLSKCKQCGQCAFGCPRGAKWTALNYLNEARENGLEIKFNTTVTEVLQKNGRAIGIKGIHNDREIYYYANTVILSAGGLGTPVILQKSGVKKAGQSLFMDLLINTYGITRGFNQINEPTMSLFNREDHSRRRFILSPFVNHNPLVRFIELGPRGLTLPTNRLIGLMTKTADESTGKIDVNGKVSKPVTDKDWKRLREGASVAMGILVEAGANAKSILFSKVQGAHPGGTAAIGQVVDQNLQTEMDHLFVCDASVLPKSPGMPPILTLCALAKWLANKLI